MGLLWLSTSLGLARTGSPPDPILDPGDPLENDNAPPLVARQNFAIPAVNPRHAHLTFNFLFRNDGPGEVTRLEVYAAIPSNRDNQVISNLSFSAPYTLLSDGYGQPIAYFQFDTLSPDQQVTVSWDADVEIETMDYGVDPGQVAGLDQIPAEVINTYTTNKSMYRLESLTIQNAAQTAANGATNPYWIARNVHDFVANRLTYLNDHHWDDAETVYLQGHGSCSEYTYLFIALCRANGLPARYVGGTRQRQEGTYVDTVFHRWAEVYLPPYGWIPVDVTHDDTVGGPVYTYFGALTDERFVTTVSGGDSEYLGWNYHYAYRYYYSGGRPNVTRERGFTWQSYPPQLRVSPSSLTKLVLFDATDAVIGGLDVISTNGAYGWSLSSATSWLQLDKTSGTTPDTVQVTADATGLDLGSHNGEVVLEFQSLDGDVAVPVEVLVVEEILETFVPVVAK
jgi:transglutaminase-like putative cysteine protease